MDSAELINRIRLITNKFNLDNISRTEAYFAFYEKHKEIQWAFLASQVSRNAGWCMCDLQGPMFSSILSKKKIQQLFLTYEKANWLIFNDAFPQLLIYDYSTKINAPMFHLLKYFHVSSFMEEEWKLFWEAGDKKRLMNSLIINEQHIIQSPVIENKRIIKNVFHSIPYLFQDLLHYNSVLFPDLNGNLYGASVSNFTSIDQRINLGNNLAAILFKSNLYQEFYDFARKVIHTGSRRDYERFTHFKVNNRTPILRMIYPVINHEVVTRQDWYKGRIKSCWRKRKKGEEPILLTKWYENKQKQLHHLITWDLKWLH